jgi:hypothetical protein
MFSPSLVSMMFHSLDPGAQFALTATRFTKSADIAVELSRLLRLIEGTARTLPVVGKTRRSASDLLYEHFPTDPNRPSSLTIGRDDEFRLFWGRLRLDQLIRYFGQYHDAESSIEYLDLGTPFLELGSGSHYDTECRRLLKSSASPGSATVGAAIVDMGEDNPGNAPDNYGGMLRHVVTSGIKMSDHAEKVLSVLLDRLDKNQDHNKNSMLASTTISCALVRPPTAYIGTTLSCFEQACAPEILDAVKALEPQLTKDGLPAAVNLSLGTHVGPHNGVSPLEDYISATMTTTERYLVVAAGNEGGLGHSAKVLLKKDEPDFLHLHTGPLCNEVLIEFWWEDSGSIDLSIMVDIWETKIAGRTVSRHNHGTLTIDASTAGMLLTTPPGAGLPPWMVMYTLFSTKCQGNFSCCAFAISATRGAALPVLQINLKLQAQNDVAVNSWVVVAEPDPNTASTGFFEGGAEGNITVPASDPSALSVAGLDVRGKVWRQSSRGPGAQYDTAKGGTQSPLMAHLSHLGSGAGTSFASPRACADAVVALADPNRRKNCTNAEALMWEVYNLKTKTPPPEWDPRIGFHKQTT